MEESAVVVILSVIIWIAFLSSFIGKWENDKREIRKQRESEHLWQERLERQRRECQDE